jgi:hypothetical protein
MKNWQLLCKENRGARTYTSANLANSGYVALIPTLVLATMLVVLSVASGQAAFTSLRIATARNNHHDARIRADDCARAALFDYAKDSNYSVSSTTPTALYDKYICNIVDASSKNNNFTVVTSGAAGNSTVTVQANFLLHTTQSEITYERNSWIEIPHL